MCFFRRRVIIYRPALSDILISLVLALFIFGLVFALVLIVGWYILLAFLGIGLLIGGGCALYIYFKSLKKAINLANTNVTYGMSKWGNFFKKLFYVFFQSAKLTLVDCFSFAGNAFIKSHAYKIISFRKWMWIIAALSIIVFGFIFVVSLLLLQLGLLRN